MSNFSPKRIVLKIIAAAAVLCLSLAVVIPAIVIRYWATPQWIDANLMPAIEATLGRDVEFHDFGFGVDGFRLDGLTISEDRRFRRQRLGDFVSIDTLVLSLDLSQLLQGRFVIDELRLVAPVIVLHTAADGRSNLASLDRFGPRKAETAEPRALADSRTMIRRLSIENATFFYRDEDRDGGLPFELVVRSIDIDASDINFAEPFDLDVETILSFTGRPEITLASRVTVDLQEPSLRFDAHADRVNVMEVIDGLNPQPPDAPDRIEDLPAVTAALPRMYGRLAVDRVESLKQVFRDVRIDADFVDNNLAVSSITATVAEGALFASGGLDIGEPGLAYHATASLSDAQAKEFLAPYLPDEFGVWIGDFSADAQFAGAGTLLDVFLDNLYVEGEARLDDGRLRRTPLLTEIAELTAIRELVDLEVQDSGGKFIVDERVVSSDRVHIGGPRGRVLLTGQVGFDAELSAELWAGIHPGGARELFSKGILLPYVEDKDGWTYIPIELSGQYGDPQTTIATKAFSHTAVNLIPDATGRLLKETASTTGGILKRGASAISTIVEKLDSALGGENGGEPEASAPQVDR